MHRTSLQHVMNRALEEAFGTRLSAELPMDVRELDDRYELALDVPGVAKESLSIDIEGQSVRIEIAEQPAVEEGRLIYSERSFGKRVRAFRLPVMLDSSASQARLDNGVLNLTLYKLKEARRGNLRIV